MDVVNQQLLQIVVERIRQAIQVEKVILFGSYAWGVPNKDSDVDLFIIVKNSTEPVHRRSRAVYRSLRDIVVPFDIIVQTEEEVAHHASISFTHHILEHGDVLYG